MLTLKRGVLLIPSGTLALLMMLSDTVALSIPFDTLTLLILCMNNDLALIIPSATLYWYYLNAVITL